MQLNIEKQLFKGFVRTEESLKNAAKAKYFLTIFTFTPGTDTISKFSHNRKWQKFWINHLFSYTQNEVVYSGKQGGPSSFMKVGKCMRFNFSHKLWCVVVCFGWLQWKSLGRSNGRWGIELLRAFQIGHCDHHQDLLRDSKAFAHETRLGK